MLLQFSVTNHRSIKDTAVISMKAAADKTMKECLIIPDGKKELVPVMAIYGANAAGKSNVLHALLLMREMVCGIYAKPLKGDELPQEPFAFVDGKAQPTTFEIIYYYDGIKYAYGYSFDKKQVISEYLYHWPNGREALVFSRKNGKYEFRENIQEQSTLAGRTPDNRLYLTSSNEWNCVQTEKAYLWFQRKIRGLMEMDETNEITIEAIRRGGQEKQRVLGEMLVADLGICNVVVSGTKDKPVISTIHQLEDEHGNKKQYSLLLGQESMGTQRFFSRIGSWMDSMEDGAILIVDEIEASMHPLLTRHLIEMVQDPLVNTNHAQLIFTTHDTGLLDLTLLRRDQIWFAEKNEKTMQTDVYALTEFSPRKGENISKGYLQGRYGAIPFVSGGIQTWEE
jgi:AAA15 family ATPase/GTPase